MAGDSPSILLNILCFCFPVIGAVVYFALQGIAPLRARSAGKATLVGIGFYAVMYGIAVVIGYMAMRQIMGTDMMIQAINESNAVTTTHNPTARRSPTVKPKATSPLPHKPAKS